VASQNEPHRSVRSLDGPAVVFEGGFRIPAAAHALSSFRNWASSDRFPDRGRIDYLEGDVEVDMSPEDLYTHGAVKTAVAAELHAAVASGDLGHVFVDRARVTAPEAGLSVEPDVVVVLWESLEVGRVRHVPASGKGPGRFAEIEGAPDLIVEIVSDGSVRKDTERLPLLYARAGVRELWRIDARGQRLLFEVLAWTSAGYQAVPPDADGRVLSPVLAARFRLTREPARYATWRYRLERSA
jgi:Uma2 family endonuclease